MSSLFQSPKMVFNSSNLFDDMNVYILMSKQAQKPTNQQTNKQTNKQKNPHTKLSGFNNELICDHYHCLNVNS